VADLELREIPIAETRPLRQAVLRPHQTLEQLATHEPDDALALGAFDGDALMAVGFVGRDSEPNDSEPNAWRVRGMATHEEARGRGAGSAILAALVQHAVDHGATRVWCNARLRARTLYERAGFRVISEQFEVPEIGPHYVMELLVTVG
jgi:ribosomal protein S18 acetylase RimI-like enzyme